MKKNLGVKTLLYPQPVLIIAAYDQEGRPCVMNAAWGGTKDKDQIAMCVNPAHDTIRAARASGAFTVSIGQADQVVACDYVGITSGNNVPDKFARAGFHATKSSFVNAPVIDELGLCFECQLVSYDEIGRFMVGRVVNVSADESVLRPDGTIDVAKLAPITFDASNLEYLKLGDAVAKAFSCGKELQ
jgi:flavin reductase (DIM6/NTAB) family NADH-FMN oxidoreductase RutF